MKKQCSKVGCSEPTIPGLRKPLCQFHYNEFQWGTKWAIRCKLEAELKDLYHEIPYIEHEMTYGYWTDEELNERYARVNEIKKSLESLK